MIRTYGLTHIGLAVKSAQRAFEFYRDVLGVKEVFREPGSIQVQTPGAHDVIVFEEKPSNRGKKIGMALHTEAKTGVLALTLKEAGAKVRLASCNPLSTDDSVAAALNEKFGLETYAKKWETADQYYENLNRVLDLGPDIVVDDGGDLVHLLHTKRRDLLKSVRGGNEETTTGIIRLRAMEREGKLEFPVVDVNDAKMKHLFDNRYGT